MTGDGIPEEVLGEILDELVVRGSDDWVMLTEVDASVRNAAARWGIVISPETRIEVDLEVVRRALESGLMIAGDVVDHAPGFVPWALSVPASLARISREWRAAGESLQMGDICWLANTSKGEARAESVHDEVNSRTGWREGGG
jgi:hypothetical protein